MKTKRLFFACLIMKMLPPVHFFRFKRYLLIWAGASIGTNVRCVSSAQFQLTGLLSIGNETWIGHEVLVIGGSAPIYIGEACDIAPRVTIVSGSHKINPSGPHVAGKGYAQPIEIGDGCWIGTGAVILGGTVIGARSVVAAGAIVKGVFPAGCLIGGVPAKIIKTSLVEC